MGEFACRACRGQTGHLVLDLGEQPACDYFPPCDDPGPDRLYPLQMWLCSSCGLAQLPASATVPEERRGDEPAALVAHAADAVRRVAATGLLPDGARVAEYGSPHGGSWLGLLADRGTHARARRRARRRGSRLLRHDARGGPVGRTRRAGGPGDSRRCAAAAVSLAGDHRSLRAVERAPARALRVLLDHRPGPSCWLRMASARAPPGVSTSTAARCCWRHRRAAEASAGPDGTIRALLARDARAGVLDPAMVLGLQVSERAHAKGLHDWLVARALGGQDRARIRCRLTGGRPVATGRSRPHAVACRGRCIRGQAGLCGCPGRTSLSCTRRS